MSLKCFIFYTLKTIKYGKSKPFTTFLILMYTAKFLVSQLNIGDKILKIGNVK